MFKQFQNTVPPIFLWFHIEFVLRMEDNVVLNVLQEFFRAWVVDRNYELFIFDGYHGRGCLDVTLCKRPLHRSSSGSRTLTHRFLNATSRGLIPYWARITPLDNTNIDLIHKK